MKKIININFHSRVIPIEETAYETLKQYIQKLRAHFAGEEGADEIVNDIEDRFAELFSDRIKKGAACITDTDVQEVITSMGRPEDFDEEPAAGEAKNFAGENVAFESTAGEQREQSFGAQSADAPNRLYRSENDKILGGVCGGIAAYFRFDPSIVRIVYALITAASAGFGILLYFILWAVLPQRSVAFTARKRLFRDPDHRVIAGVAGGLAAYLHIAVWIPRLIFATPLILGLLVSIFNSFDPFGSTILTSGFGGTLFITYLILWIVLPEAVTASEKLEMRGEKVDIESITNTIRNDLSGFKSRAAVVGQEMRSRAKDFSKEIRESVSDFRYSNPSPAGAATESTPRRSGIGHAIGVLFRAFFLFISVMITFGLIVGLIGALIGGSSATPLLPYFMHGFWDSALGWATLTLFVLLPVVALLTFLIRRIIGARARRSYLRYIFGTLWIVGLICFLFFLSSLIGRFRTRAGVSEDLPLTTPASGKLLVTVHKDRERDLNEDWMGIHLDRQSAFYNLTDDSAMLTTVRVEFVKSDDSLWHMHVDKSARGNNVMTARQLAGEIDFRPQQHDSVLSLPGGFAITPKQQFRNQQVAVVIEVPVGRHFTVDASVEDYRWFTVHSNRHGVGVEEWDGDWENNNPWTSGVDYVMNANGSYTRVTERAEQPEHAEKKERPEKKEPSEKPEQKEQSERPGQKEQPERLQQKERPEKPEPASPDSGGYRYHGPTAAGDAPANSGDEDREEKTDGASLRANTSETLPLIHTLLHYLSAAI